MDNRILVYKFNTMLSFYLHYILKRHGVEVKDIDDEQVSIEKTKLPYEIKYGEATYIYIDGIDETSDGFNVFLRFVMPEEEMCIIETIREEENDAERFVTDPVS